MGDTFTKKFFTSPETVELYGKTIGLFTGGKWISTPLTDPTTGKDMAKWWYKSFEKFTKAVSSSTAYTNDMQAKAKTISKLVRDKLKALLDPSAGSNKEELGTVVINSLTALQETLPFDALASDPKFKDAVSDFKDASFSAAKEVVAIVENADRNQDQDTGSESLGETIAELQLRVAGEGLYNEVGDPPESLYIHTEDQPDIYVLYACLGLYGKNDTDILLPSKTPYFSEFRQLVHDFLPVDQALKSGKNSDGSPLTDAQRQDLVERRAQKMIDMSQLLQALGTETNDLATTGSEDAGRAAELSMIFAETVRGVLGEARGPGKLDSVNQAEVDERKTQGSEAVEGIKEGREFDEEEEMTA